MLCRLSPRQETTLAAVQVAIAVAAVSQGVIAVLGLGTTAVTHAHGGGAT